MESDSEDEIFFGPVTAKEEAIAAPLRNRKTEVFVLSSSLLGCRSSVPSLSSLEEEDCIAFSSDSKQSVLNHDLHLADSKDTCDANKLSNDLRKEASYEDSASFSTRRAVDENNVTYSCTNSEDDENNKSTVHLFGHEVDLLSTEVSKEAADSDSVNVLQRNILEVGHEDMLYKDASDNDSLIVSQGNCSEVSQGIAAKFSSAGFEDIKEVSQPPMINSPEVAIHDAEIPSAKVLGLTKEDISKVQALSSSTDIGEPSQKELMAVPKEIMFIDTEIERETSPYICTKVCDNDEIFADIKIRDETMSVADANVAQKVMSSPSKFSTGDISSCSSVRVQEKVVAFFDDKIFNLESSSKDTMEVESVATKSDDYIPALKMGTGEYIMINNGSETDYEAVSLASLTIDESRSVSAAEIVEESEAIVTSTKPTHIYSADVSEYANKIKDGDENVSSPLPALDTVAFKCDQNVPSVILEEASPSDTRGNCLKDPNTIDNCLSLCFCNDIEAGALLGDKSKDDCVCSQKSLVLNHLGDYNGDANLISVCASGKQFSMDIENFPSQCSADVINRDVGLSSVSGPSLANSFSNYPQSIDSSSESYDVNNKAMIFSQTPSLDSGLSSSHEYSPVKVLATSTECERKSVSFANSSKSGPEFNEPILCNDQGESNTEKSPSKINYSSEDVSDDETQSEVGSPCRKFNDTIEEMEMLLKYGVNYGETGVSRNTCSDADDKKPDDYEIDCTLDDSIVSPRKSSIMSSVSHFDPEFNSTSVPITKNCAVPAKLEGNMETQGIQELNTNSDQLTVTKASTPAALSKVTRGITPAAVLKATKALPPQKPPRNAFMSSPSPLKSNLVQNTRSHLTPDLSEVNCVLRKDEIVRRGISKSNPTTPKSTPRRFNPSTPQYSGVKSKLNTGLLSQKLESRMTNKTPAKIVGVTRSTSLTNMTKENRLHGSVPVSPLCAPSTQANSASSGRYTPKSQTPRPTANERLQHKQSHAPNSTPNRFLGKPPTGHTSRMVQKVKALTPNPLVKKQAYIRQAGMNIVSPVARYLRENPPPPLVINVKPRHKITGNVEKVTQMDGMKAPPESADAKCRKANQRPKHAPVLPVALYSPAVPVLLDNNEDKENERSKKLQEICSSSQQLLVMKHKGRVKVPKVKFKDEANKDSSPKGCKIPNPVEAAITPVRNSSVRGSLMEVSIYEPHRTQYTDTLK